MSCLTIRFSSNSLMVEGTRPKREVVQYLHHGMDLRPFIRQFELADPITVVIATLENGLFMIDLMKVRPEETWRRHIAINAEAGQKPAPAQINQSALLENCSRAGSPAHM